MRPPSRFVLTVAPGALFLLLWEVAVGSDPRLNFLYASPSLIAAAAAEEFVNAEIWNHVGITLGEALLGLLLGCVLGTLCGLLLWSSELIAKIAEPYLVVLGSIPVFAIAPMLVMWFGIGLLSKVIMAALAVFFVAMAQSYEGARHCSREHLTYARSIAAPRRYVLTKIIIPGALRWVVAGIKMSIGLSIFGAFIGEFISSEAGLGHYILTAKSLYDVPRVLLGILLLSSSALALTSLVWLVERSRPNLFFR